jgi:hypothetical protein
VATTLALSTLPPVDPEERDETSTLPPLEPEETDETGEGERSSQFMFCAHLLSLSCSAISPGKLRSGNT